MSDAQRKDPYLILSNPIGGPSAPDDRYRSIVGAFIAREQNSHFATRFNKLLEKPKFRACFPAFSTRFDEADRPIYIHNVPRDRLWEICKYTLLAGADVITDLVECRDKVEHGILIGSYDQSESGAKLS